MIKEEGREQTFAIHDPKPGFIQPLNHSEVVPSLGGELLKNHQKEKESDKEMGKERRVETVRRRRKVTFSVWAG